MVREVLGGHGGGVTIDLRSDTCSRPTRAMRAAMADAEVGDDVYGDDPTVRALEERTAALLGKADAVYMPSGTMTNQVGIRVHTQPGDAVLMDRAAHVHQVEGGSTAALSGVVPRLLPSAHGVFDAVAVRAMAAPRHPFFPVTFPATARLLCVENSHNEGGGTVWRLDEVQAVTEAGRAAGLALHLDGARLWHAAVATGSSEADYAAPFDTVSVCFSKALGAPVGSCLAGSREFVGRARRFKQQFGGGFRQAGIIAAGALFALEHHRAELGRTHETARRFAHGLAAVDGIDLDPSAVETNIVRFRLTTMPAGSFVEAMLTHGVHLLPAGPDAVRAVFYLDIGEADADAAIRAARETLAHAGPPLE